MDRPDVRESIGGDVEVGLGSFHFRLEPGDQLVGPGFHDFDIDTGFFGEGGEDFFVGIVVTFGVEADFGSMSG